MATNFKIKTRTKPSKIKQQPTEQNSVVSFSNIVTKQKRSPYLSYLSNGEEKVWTGKYTKLPDGSYIYENSSLSRVPLELNYSYIYKTIKSHFSYYDKDGNERTCNILDSIQYDEELNTYTGEIGVVDYIDEEIEIYPNED